jgi:hypothetical protein
VLTNGDLEALLMGKQLQVLRLGGTEPQGKATVDEAAPALTPKACAIVAGQRSLRRLDLSHARWIDAAALKAIAALPELSQLDLTATSATDAALLAALGASRSLRSLKLVWCTRVDAAALQALRGARLAELDVYGTNLKAEQVREAAKAWPGCTIKLPDGQRLVVPR